MDIYVEFITDYNWETKSGGTSVGVGALSSDPPEEEAITYKRGNGTYAQNGVLCQGEIRVKRSIALDTDTPYWIRFKPPSGGCTIMGGSDGCCITVANGFNKETIVGYSVIGAKRGDCVGYEKSA